MKKRWILALGLCLVMALFAFGCGAGDHAADPKEEVLQQDPAADQESEPPAVPETPVDRPEVQIPSSYTEKVILYYANDEYIETGRSDLPRLLPFETEIEYTSEEGPLMAMLEALKEVPAGTEGLSTVISKDITFLDARIGWENDEVVFEENGEPDISYKILYVDISAEGLGGGSLTEELFIEQIVETLLAKGAGNGGFISDQYGPPEKVQFLV
ncbi:MAG: GerMN domain-containing protein, partial [Firmicutes bacterium]|nr:GerMN domain-containing protein [Bacillota bacterium]